MKILDASAILHGGLDFSGGGFLVTNSVLAEVLDEKAKLLVDQGIRERNIRVKDPSKAGIGKVKSAAEASGDLARLSLSDMEVLALALEEDADIVSDDYSIQNVASFLGIGFIAAAQEGIKDRYVWEKACPGCGKKHPGSAAVCDICGLPLRSVGRKP